MKIYLKDYKNLDFMEALSNQFLLDYMEKYYFMPYSVVDEFVLIILSDSFNYWNLNIINQLMNNEYYIHIIPDEEWKQFFQLFKLTINRVTAINELSKNDQILKEDSNLAYDLQLLSYPIVKIVDSIIAEAIKLRASDIHLLPMINKVLVKFRIDGTLYDKFSFDKNSYNELVSRIKVLANVDITKTFQPQDGKIKYKYEQEYYDIRVAILPTIYGERITLRLLEEDTSKINVHNIGICDADFMRVEKLINLTAGLILVVGATGMGKSTTLHAFLKENSKQNKNIITIEDPVEYCIDGTNQVQVNENIGLTFATGLRSILRHDPNVIMIGEIRDFETAHIACRAAMTGHLVYSTLHASTTYGAIIRLVEMNVEKYVLADALEGIISQRLVRCLCPYCKKKRQINAYEKEMLNIQEDIDIYYASKCNKCNFTGYLGRIGIYEIININDEIKKLIRNDLSMEKFSEIIKKNKINTLFNNAKLKVIEGVTSIEEIKSLLTDNKNN